MKKKRILITIGIICASLVVLCSVFALVFRLKTVDVEFRTRVNQAETNLPAGIQDKVMKDANFGIGKNLVFMNIDKNIENIEKYNPYVKVEQVIRYFPNTVRVYISERQPRFRVRDTIEPDRWYILDEEFKVLDKVTTGELTTKSVFSGKSTYYKKTIEINPNDLTVSSYIGEFIDETVYRAYFNAIASGIYGKAKDYAIAKRFSIIQDTDGTLKFQILMRNANSRDTENDEGGIITLVGKENLMMKANRGVACYIDHIWDDTEHNPTESSVSVEEKNGIYYVIAKNSDGVITGGDNQTNG